MVMERPSTDLVLVLGIAAIVPWLVVWRYSSSSSASSSSSSSRRRQQRSYSFTSLASLLGPFPKEANVAETIINAAIFYDDCPTLADLEEQVIKPMLQYERLAASPQLPSSLPGLGWFSKNSSSSSSNSSSSGNSSNHNTEAVVQPKDMRRHVMISGDDSLTHATINRYLLDSLEDTASRGSSSSSNKNLPWWEFVVIENKGSNGKSAVLLRMHHGLADGLSLVQVFEKILTDEHGKSIASPLLQHAASSALRERVKPSLWSILSAIVETIALSSSRFDADILFSRNAHGQRHKQMMSSTRNNSRGVVSPILLPPVPVDYVKKLKNAANVTVNDIVMTAMSQAIRDYCLDQNCPVLLQHQTSHKTKTLQYRTLLPVGVPVRSKKELDDDGADNIDKKKGGLRNSFCMTSIDMCLGEEDIEERLRRIHTNTMALKTSPIVPVTMWIQNRICPWLPRSVTRQTLYDTFCRHSLVFSNVPGPSVKCLLAGKLVTGIQMFYPNLIPQVGLLSYAGYIHGNIIITTMDKERALVPKPERLAKFYAAALLDLGKRLLGDSDEAVVNPPKDLVIAAAVAASDS
jgi:WS/DGAT C-terminal domain/Wax ester synthase-like Acyl-CoA acyltransferase domain